MRRIALCQWLVITLFVAGSELAGQQTSIQTPLVGMSEGFYEHFNVGWGFHQQFPRGSMFFEFNSPAFPPFGGYQPNADARFGMVQRWGNGNFHFRFAQGTGSTRTLTMTSASVTSLNGLPASVADVTIRPFVTGLIPTVGNFPVFPYYPSLSTSPTVLTSPLAGKYEHIQKSRGQGTGQRPRPKERDVDVADSDDPILPNPNRQVSTAERGDVSIDEIEREQAQQRQQRQAEVDELIEQAQAAERDGLLIIARVRYKQAAAKASASQRKELLAAASKLQSR